MKVIDLFAGAGGLSEGFKRQGFNIVSHVEMDKSACLTLKTREAYFYLKEQGKIDTYKKYITGEISRDELYGYIPDDILKRVINESISDETIEDIFKLIGNEEIDIIIGGPPCQAYSLVGRSRDPNRMKNDPRNYLYRQYIKFIIKYKPKLFIFENVTGILSAQEGKIFENIKDEMKKVGYNLDYRILDASDFGVLQSRKRVILIGWKVDINFSYPDFGEVELKGTINDLFHDLPSIQSGDSIEVGKYLNTSNEILTEMKIRSKEWDILTQHTARKNNDRDLKIYKYCVEIWNKERRRVRYDELPKDWITHNNLESFLDRFKVVDGSGLSHTMVAHISKDGHHYIHPDINQNRSLTVREAARIQSFPDDYYFETCRTDAFRQIGNAVPPLMAEKIAIKVLEEIKKQRI
ncbi:DNA cytosine methyltransferase [Tissierella carlieri]|uniref:DNA cytosine methyltransferase n=1 Tax=Tissierella carlieri TaxID=689904 RepID=UPI001C126585|nr:DNA cytosine methyltransferase [Tissierella carlieri]MBU5311862.1 DNA cytosine methyltransferase [Tissierella carlieri]